ncbi:hypothetical protein [Nonomuraea insulae]|uniref:Uncharacterized protein n=1 Tax=Nonomuraea insulae TaxID=1616787 RepID=A0ABW1CST7_9ACTN
MAAKRVQAPIGRSPRAAWLGDSFTNRARSNRYESSARCWAAAPTPKQVLERYTALTGRPGADHRGALRPLEQVECRRAAVLPVRSARTTRPGSTGRPAVPKAERQSSSPAPAAQVLVRSAHHRDPSAPQLDDMDRHRSQCGRGAIGHRQVALPVTVVPDLVRW